MSRTVNCAKLGREAEGLDFAPWPGDLGKRIYENISKEAWQLWIQHQTMIINEYRLNAMDPEARKMIATEMEKFEAATRRSVEALFALEPFASRQEDFNVWGIAPPAAESGISRPRSGMFRDSPLGASYNALDSERYVLTLQDRDWRDVAAAAPYDFVMILVNSEKWVSPSMRSYWMLPPIPSARAWTIERPSPTLSLVAVWWP